MKKQLFTITGYRDELFTRELPLIEGYLRFKSTRRELHISMTPEKAEEIVREAPKILTSIGWFYVHRIEGERVYIVGDENNDGFFFKFQIEKYA
jgi:hypothetical protein